MPARVGATTSTKTNSKPIQTQTNMVFSLTSLKTPSILKVVERDRLFGSKEKRLTADFPTGAVTDSSEDVPGCSRSHGVIPTPSHTEVYLKSEPRFETSTMYTMDSESFQDLGALCSASAREGPAPIIDFLKPTEELSKDTLYTQYSPTGWETFDPISPSSGGTSLYNTNASNKLTADPFSPHLNPFDTTHFSEFEDKRSDYEQFINIDDISSMPVVIGELETDLHSTLTEAGPTTLWSTQHYTHDTKYTNSLHKTPFIDEEDSLDLKLSEAVAVEPRKVEWPDVVISEITVNDQPETRRPSLKLDVLKAASYNEDPIISTPEVLSYVEQLETDDLSLNTSPWQLNDSFTDCHSPQEIDAFKDYEPITPKTESHIESDVGSPTLTKKRRLDSEDSDESYTPYSEKPTTRKYKRRKPSVPIKEMIMALEEAQPLTKVRRGRPPKRRDSAVSSVCSTENGANAPHESKYREVRDKNNEASKRSRMNRRLKELQMEQLAIELEERNRKLKVKADVLEDLTKKLKGALMSAILKQ